MKVRAKFYCLSITDYPETETKMVDLWPVIDGSAENRSFSKYTPSGRLTLNISNDTPASESFEEGKEYYIDISPAE